MKKPRGMSALPSHEEVARRRIELEFIYVENPVAEAIIESLEEYRAYSIAHTKFAASLPPERRRATKVAVKVLPILGESGVGKSVAFRQFIGRTVAAEEEGFGTRRALEVPLGQGATTRTFWCDVLQAYEDPLYDRGTKKGLMKRAHHFRGLCKTEVWIFDETNHLIDTDTQKRKWDVAESMKSLAETNTVGMVIVGQENVLDITRENGQIGLRSEPLIHVRPLDLAKAPLRKMAEEYLSAYAERMVELGTLAEKPDLAGQFFGDIAEVSYGRLGTAAQFVIHVGAYAWRAGSPRLEQCHFDAARETWANAHNIMSKETRKRPRQ